MGKKIKENGPNSGKLRFVVETAEEREIMEKARTYFGDATTLLRDGLGIFLKSKVCSTAYFIALKNENGRSNSLTPKQWEEMKKYAVLSDEGKRYSGVVILPEV